MITSSDFEEVRAFYDEQKSKRLRRREEIRIELNKRVEAEEQEETKELARLLHHKYNLGVTKTELREAIRKYNSPTFKDIWDSVEYVPPATPVKPQASLDSKAAFQLDGNRITFARTEGDWDWTGVEAETLTFVLKESENTGHISLSWDKDQPEHALFNMKNLSSIAVELKGVYL